MANHPKKLIYKITPRCDWEQARAAGQFTGAPIDLADGYIHFSDADQIAETAAKHFSHQDDLLLIAVDTALLGDVLKWEISRGGARFPHLYANLDMSTVVWEKPMPLGADGIHVLPDLAA